jgi:predicted ATPase/DNA-binding CsgD family transcriptional regulator
MGIHQGRAEPLDGDYFGVAVNRAARVADSGHGGQVVISAAAAATISPPPQVQLGSRGAHQLKDLAEPVELFQALSPHTENELLPLRTVDASRNHLPTQRTSFFGRQDEVRRAVRLLDDARLLTLCGLGGVGKTRLALQVAADVAASFADGAQFVDLSRAGVDDDLGAVVAEQLPSWAPSSATAVASRAVLTTRMLGREVLVLLDNCEHVVDQAAALAGALLDAIPMLKIIVTSREPLRIAGESVMRVEPFEAPTGPDPAVQLFVDRARAAGAPPFATTELSAIARVCDLVDRLPLGIELAAARTTHLRVEELHERLREHHGVLVSQDRDRSARHRTIEKLLDWSVALLDEPGRQLFSGMGLFAGPVDLAALEAVCADEVVDRPEMLNEVGSLVDRSLVVHDPEYGTYRMLGLVRSFAGGLLAARPDRSTLQGRYWAWCAALGEGADDDQLTIVTNRYATEVAAALASAVAAGQPAAAWAIAGWSWRVSEMTGRLDDGISTLERALQLGGEADRATAGHAQTCNGLATLLMARGDTARAAELHRCALTTFQTTGDPVGQGWSLTGLSIALIRDEAAELAEAALHAEHAITLFAARDDQRGLGHAHVAAALAAIRQRRNDTAHIHLLEALGAFRLGRNRRDAAAVLTNLGNLALDQGDLLRASRFFDGAHQLSIEIGDLRSAGFIVNNLCLVASHRGDHARAQAYARQALGYFDQVGDQQGCAVAHLHLANGLAHQNERGAALAAYRDAVEHFRAARDARGVITSLANLSQIAWGWGARTLAWRCEVDRATVADRLDLKVTYADALRILVDRAAELGNRALADRLVSGITAMDGSAEQVLSDARLHEPADEADETTVPTTVLPGLADLTGRERHLLRLLGQGRTNEELAAELFISRRTVDAHLNHIRTKLGITDRVKLAVLARDRL